MRSLVANVGLAAVAVGVALAAAEAVVRVAGLAEPLEPLYVRSDGPVLYGLNPAHPEISVQATRDDAVAVPKPPGVFRILVLGDSVAYGLRVAREDAFPSRLEERLRDVGRAVEVVNASVPGYTAYNELEDYRSARRALEPDLVLVATCLNDVANPRLHWNYTRDAIRTIPPAAIPNRAYDRRVQRELAAAARAGERQGPPETPASGVWGRSALYRFLQARTFAEPPPIPTRLLALRAQAVPTLITAEDDLGIEVWLGDTPEWRWLTGTYTTLAAAVRADGAEPVFAILPLAYQLDPVYPHRPQERLLAWCETQRLRCLDLLPALRGHAPDEVFLMERSGFPDIWHLTERGHDLVAEAIALELGADAHG